MISYADMLTLLLAVFIVLFAAAKVNKSKLATEAASLLQAFQGQPPSLIQAPSTPNGPQHSLPNPVPRPMDSVHSPHSPAKILRHSGDLMSEREQQSLQPTLRAMRLLDRKLIRLLEPEIVHHKIAVITKPLSIKIRLNAKILFQNAHAKLTDPAKNLLDPIGDVLAKIPPGYLVTVQGDTDSMPIKTAKYASNWQLSTARAVSVVELFRSRHVSGSSLSAQGFSKYHPIASNKTAVGRAQNRRVEIVITAPKPQPEVQ